MRNALILLVLVAAVVALVGAANRELTIDLDWVFGTWSSVSLVWVAIVVAVLLVAAGMVAVVLATWSGIAARRRLERELTGVYGRLRTAEKSVAAQPAKGPVDEAAGGGDAPAMAGGPAGEQPPPAAEPSDAVALAQSGADQPDAPASPSTGE